MKDFAGSCRGCCHDFAFHYNQSVRRSCGLSGLGNRGKGPHESGMRFFILSRDEAKSESNCALCTPHLFLGQDLLTVWASCNACQPWFLRIRC